MKSLSLGQLSRKPMELRSDVVSGVERGGGVCDCCSSGLEAVVLATVSMSALFYYNNS